MEAAPALTAAVARSVQAPALDVTCCSGRKLRPKEVPQLASGHMSLLGHCAPRSLCHRTSQENCPQTTVAPFRAVKFGTRFSSLVLQAVAWAFVTVAVVVFTLGFLLCLLDRTVPSSQQ